MLLRAGVSPLLEQRTARQVLETGAVPQSRGSEPLTKAPKWCIETFRFSRHRERRHFGRRTPNCLAGEGYNTLGSDTSHGTRRAVLLSVFEEWSMDGRLQNTVIPSSDATPWLSLCLRFPQCLSRIMV